MKAPVTQFSFITTQTELGLDKGNRLQQGKFGARLFFFFCILGAETEIRNVKSKNAVGTSWT